MEPRTILDAVPAHCAYQISSARITQISLANVKLPAHVAFFSHRYFRESTRSQALVKREIKSILLNGLGTGSVHRPDEVSFRKSFIKVNRDDASHHLNQFSSFSIFKVVSILDLEE